MAKATNNILYLQQLFTREAHELYQDEKLLIEAFELFRQAASNPVLGELFERARRETIDISHSIKEHLEGEPLKGRRPALRGILEEGQQRAHHLADHHLVDAELIATMQRLLGYQLAGYENVASFARILREDAMRDTVERAIEQKRRTVQKLSNVALHQVHWRATWWAPEHTSSWDRVKAAFRRDWEQTKARVGAAPPPPGGQEVGDTLAQISGRQPVGETDTFEADEPAFRYGYGAANHYHDRHWDRDLEDELRHNYGGMWDEDRDRVRAGWEYARPAPERPRHIKLHLEDNAQPIIVEHDAQRPVMVEHDTQRPVMVEPAAHPEVVEPRRGPILLPEDKDHPVI